MHYGDISTAVSRHPAMDTLISDIKAVLGRYERAGS
jgi:uncharacterized protein (DUF1800 family)